LENYWDDQDLARHLIEADEDLEIMEVSPGRFVIKTWNITVTFPASQKAILFEFLSLKWEFKIETA